MKQVLIKDSGAAVIEVPAPQDSRTYGSEAWLESRFRVVADDPWGGDWKAHDVKRYEFVLEVIRERLRGKNLEPLAETCLDIGCATGHFSKRVSELFQRVVAVDLSHTAVERARLNYPEIDFRCGALPYLSCGSGAFKLVTCLEVLYYLDRDVLELALEEVNRVLRSDGLVVFSAVAGKAPYFTTQELLARISKTFDVEWCEVYGSRAYMALAGVLDDYYEWLQKLERLSISAAGGGRSAADSSQNWSKRSRWCLAAFQNAARIRLCAGGIIWGARLQRAVIRRVLGLGWPVRLALRFTKVFNLQGTHTIVLASKRPQRSPSS
jgi:2-polyprenyl-3-methyl-5-hydroxy-6-metoxy-1,4-benzoquinol methylase